MNKLWKAFKITATLVFLIALIIIGNKYRYFLSATFNEVLTPWSFEMPKVGENFYVHSEVGACPRAMQRIIVRAFPEYKVVFFQKKSPHLILKEYYAQTDASQNIKVPYLCFSGEYENLRWKRFRPSGYPFLEITAHKKEGSNFIFLPYISYGKPNLRKLFTESLQEKKRNSVRPLQVAYISSHFIKERELMFKLLRDRFPKKAIALGKCSRTPGYEAPGTYSQLKDIYKRYNFGLAMENHNRKGYITEKITNVFEAGSIPIYWGASDLAKELFNPKAFIDINDYKSFEEAADAVVTITQDKKLLKKLLHEPMFKNNKIPPLLLVNDDVLSKEEEDILQKMARKMRISYNSYLEHKKKPSLYWKALDLPFLTKDLIHNIKISLIK